ncbi:MULTISPECIES: 2-dehydropantoate 2-reductase [unclassified Brevibacterium]|uniref:2-dehydropantoate 2-reductase n=1 Tax=unclassified Brevibacterium TaxID=2614124 RepID=UPI001E3926DB|nr:MULTISPECIES: 2-dehydropantoate 2-reductase [unclassified Brevibacterium]MCD1284527.1 2-dehydropantoate 2-reductase [Brevibacterium sp. CCUG 69071]MDK8435855.1 2-dehydropantoate 2-reductase [Brevibacterium sp. H-BE7]
MGAQDMKILIAGAGATGGAFGTRLLEAGRDVTFLVRPARAEKLRAHGLRFIAPGEDQTNDVAVLTAAELAEAAGPERGDTAFDLVIVAVKANGLESIIDDIRPAVGPGTQIIPFLNGMAQIDRLTQEFPGQVLGGLVKIVGTIKDDAIVQMTDLAVMTIGDLDGAEVPADISKTLDVPGFKLQIIGTIVDGLWEKWVFIAAAGVVTCLFRAPVGAIMEAGGRDHVVAIVDELEAIAAAAGHPVSKSSREMTLSMLTAAGSDFTSSLYRDVTAGLPSETEHILGDLARAASELGVATPLLDLTLVQLRAGETLRVR